MPARALKDRHASDDSVRVEPVLAAPRARRRTLRPRRLVFAGLAAVAACAVAIAAFAASGPSGARTQATAAAARPAAAPDDGSAMPPPLKPRPKAVQALGPGQAPPAASVTPRPGADPADSRPQTDEEIRAELASFRQHLSVVGTPRGPRAAVQSDGTAVAPHGVPGVVLAVITAGNEIATKPYKWGGGHGAWRDSGYDCSGSVSFALAGAGLLDGPMTSGGFMRYGDPGPGRWITIYSNPGHMFMVVAGLRFDTSGAQGGTRWQAVGGRSYSGFTVRHPPGL